jgi:Cu-processing system ATP-binding protein
MNRGAMVAHGSIDELRRIARLPTKIRLTISDEPESIRNWLGTDEKWRRVNGRVVEIEASPERKIELLRRATVAGTPVKDVDVMQPTLDELYAHFLRTHEPHDEKRPPDCR